MIPFKQYITELSKPNDVDLVKAAFRDLRDEMGQEYFTNTFYRFGVWHSPSTMKRKIEARSVMKRALGKYGFELIGAGAKGAAFAHDKYPYIIKIFSYDDGYMDYLRFAAKHPNNKYVPKFKGQATKIFDEIYYVRVEKLEEIASLTPKLVSIMSEFEDISRLLRKYGERALTEKNLRVEKDMLEFCRYLSKVPENFGVDLHDGNFMQRPNGQIVVIDPLIG
jgi:hypothetical protein